MPQPNEYVSVARYLEILWKCYPGAKTKVELSREAGVSKAAITKVKGRLFDLCEVEALAKNGKYRLKRDLKTIKTLFLVSIWSEKSSNFLESSYLRSVVSDPNIIRKITEAIPSYSRYFTEEDTNLIINFLLHIASFASQLIKGDAIDILKEHIDDEEYVVSSLLSSGMTNLMIGELSQGKITEFIIELDPQTLFSLRDKLYFFVTDFSSEIFPKLGILSKIESENEKETYVSVYRHTFEYYFKGFLESASKVIVDALKEVESNNARLDDISIGRFFNPLMSLNDTNQLNPVKNVTQDFTSSKGRSKGKKELENDKGS
ncbi:MAG: hypothetical protein M1556_01225 [Candidatus Thermoplasmatota archaeon]|jgi:hypothetical protein|nr:hypothetical protein [Candidatus Thermoplasmatota archaeon]MCL6002256.1 hypothetical protein [Candidatus Thermoplasmatota archaeon]